MTTPEFPAEPSAPTPSQLANWGQRAVGFLIDYAPLWILQIIFRGSAGLSGLLSLVGLAYLVYLGYLDGTAGQTPGKAMMGLRLVNRDGEVIGSGPGIGRKFLHIIDSLVFLLGWLLPIVDSKRQTIADKIMSTYVVAGVEKKSFAVTLWLPPKQGATI